jgi:hypothetical protein
MRLEKQVEVREEKLRDQKQRLQKFEKIVQEKHLDERYELKEKLSETDKKLQAFQEKLANQVNFVFMKHITINLIFSFFLYRKNILKI